MGVIFKVNSDASGNPVPTLDGNAVGYGMLPLDLNYDEAYGQIGPVLIGTGDWDNYSYLQVACISAFYNEVDVTGPLELLQPQGDVSMGNFQATPGGWGFNANASRSAGLFGRQSGLGPGSYVSGTSTLTGTSGD